MATIRILSRCAGGEHLTVEWSALAGVRREDVAWSELREPITDDDIQSWLKITMRLAAKTDGAKTFAAMKTAIESRTYTE
jgi:hypothetical protein